MGTLAETRREGEQKLSALIDAQMRTEERLSQFISEVERLIKARRDSDGATP